LASRNKLRVLFLCTGNSARSILGEFLLKHLAGERVAPFSAGVSATGRVHPLALETLADIYDIDASTARSHGLEGLKDLEDHPFDLVFTVCDHARESCPLWPLGTQVIHWGLPDPAAAEGSDEQKRQAFRDAASELHRRLRRLCSGPIETMEPEALEAWARRAAEGGDG